jgi:hypothetical protein
VSTDSFQDDVAAVEVRGARTMAVRQLARGICTSCQVEGPVINASFGTHTGHYSSIRLCDPCKHAFFSACLALDI